MKKFQIFSLLVAFSFLFVACDDDDDLEDTVAPEIKSVTINEEDHDIMVMAGEEMHIDAELSDNEALGELKIDVHDVFEGHSHGKKSAFKWAEVLTVELSGKEQTVHEHMDVPEDATAGPYHAILRVIDEEGNEGEFEEVEFMISNGSEPMINVTDPDFSNEVHAPKGSTLSLVGTITDDTDLEEIIIHLKEEHDDDHDHKSAMDEEIYEEDFDLDGTADTSWDFQADGNVNISIPADAEEGHYELMIRAMDSEGNMNIFEAEVHVH